VPDALPSEESSLLQPTKNKAIMAKPIPIYFFILNKFILTNKRLLF
jgi:hypothetical protein